MKNPVYEYEYQGCDNGICAAIVTENGKYFCSVFMPTETETRCNAATICNAMNEYLQSVVRKD